MIIFRWNGTDLTQFGTVATGGSISVSGGKIVLAASPGNHNKDTLGFYVSGIYGNRPGMSTEYDWEINDLGPGDGFSPNQINLITTNSPEAGSPTPFPDWRVGLGLWLEEGTDNNQYNTLRDTQHNPNTLSPTILTTNTTFHLKQSIASNGVHTYSVNGDNFSTGGPTTSGGNYAGIVFAGDTTKNNDFNNTTDPLTVINAVTNYTITRAFSDGGWQLNKYFVLSDAGGNLVEVIRPTAINGNNVTFARGQLGTTAAAIPNGRGIYVVPDLRFYWQNQSGSITTRYSNVIITDDGTYTPPAPTSLSASTGGAGAINLAWSDASVTSTNADQIKIERSTSSGSGFSQIGTAAIGAQAFADSGLSNSTTYFYRIRASVTYNGSNANSSYTSEASAVSGGGGGGGGGSTTGPVTLTSMAYLVKEDYEKQKKGKK